MSLGKGIVLIGVGGAALWIALDPSVFAGWSGIARAAKGLATNPTALANVANGRAPDDPSQSLGDFLATHAGDTVFDALTKNPSPLHVTQGAPAEMPKRCQDALSACWTRCTSQTDYACINQCLHGVIRAGLSQRQRHRQRRTVRRLLRPNTQRIYTRRARAHMTRMSDVSPAVDT